jgi:hypothetical protein
MPQGMFLDLAYLFGNLKLKYIYNLVFGNWSPVGLVNLPVAARVRASFMEVETG